MKTVNNINLTNINNTDNKKRLKFSETIMLGLLLFGLFFGAGNVIFPVKLGQLSGHNYLIAAAGFIITAVGLPILGIISSALSKRNGLLDYTNIVGKNFSLLFTLLLYLTIGPFFAIPRTATTAFEVGFGNEISGTSQIPLLIYTVIFFSLVWLFSRSPNKIMDIIGKFLTPLFLLLIAVLLIAALFFPVADPMQNNPEAIYTNHALAGGILDGYNTMDALASLAFAIIIKKSIEQLGIKDPKIMAKETAKASIVTIFLFTILYGGLVYLGASTRSITDISINGGRILATAGEYYFGQAGQILLALTIAVACLKTAAGLVISISDTFQNIFPKTSYKFWMYTFIIISFTISNFGLNQIIQWSIPILMFLYPISIVFIVTWLMKQVIPFKDKVFTLTIALTTIAALFDLLKNLPLDLPKTPVISKILDMAINYLPFFEIGIGWLLPASCGLLLGIIIFGFDKKSLKIKLAINKN